MLDDAMWLNPPCLWSAERTCPFPHISCEQAHHQAPSRNVAAAENRVFWGGELNGGDGGF
jgi:hypothetical protein